MSRFWLLSLTCACGLALTAAPALARDPKQRPDRINERAAAPEILLTALKQKVDFDGSKIGEQTLTEVLQALAKKHNVTFVIVEDEFKAKRVEDVKEKKARIKQLDTKGLTVAEFLDAWLPGLGATYKVQPDYVEVVPLLRINANARIDAKPAKKADPTEVLLTTLEQEFQLKEGANVNEIPLFELLQFISKQYSLTFVIDEESFKQFSQPNIKEEKPKFASTQLRGLTIRQFLTVTLESMGGTYLVKGNAIEIVPLQRAARVTKAGLSTEEGDRVRLNEPLVSAIFKEKPLNEAVAKIAEMYDLTVVVSPQAGDAKTGFVTARLLNVPADKAIELLALQCDLRVVRRGNAFLITSRDHANELFGEKLEKERQLIEIQKLREAPAKPPAPPPPEKPPEKPLEKAPVFGAVFKDGSGLSWSKNLSGFQFPPTPPTGTLPVIPGQPSLGPIK
jgi:hypothetical protein